MAEPAELEVEQRVRAAAERLGQRLERLSLEAAATEGTGDDRDSPVVDAAVAAALDGCLAELASLRLEPASNRALSTLLWKPNRRWLEQGVLQRRAREKPLGYAGDYQMLQWIADNATPASTLLGRAQDRYFQSLAAPRSVRARIAQAAELFRQAAAEVGDRRRCGWLSVGCGAAPDVGRAMAGLQEAARRRVQVALWDLDQRALEFAAAGLRPWLREEQVLAQRVNPFRLQPRSPSSEPFQGVVCSGLFDYLDREQAVATLRTLWTFTAPGGELLIHNFDGQHASRDYMEWIGNWYLIYRDRDAVRELAAEAALDEVADTSVTPLENASLWALRIRRRPA